MLILSRRIDEKIIIGEGGEIEVIVLNMKHGQVKIGISAPKNIMVHREEIYNKIKRLKEQKCE